MEKEEIDTSTLWGKVSKFFMIFEDNLSGMLLLAAVFTMTYEVFSRYFFHTPIYWSSEWSPVLITWSMLLGNAALVRRKEHIALTMVEEALKKDSDKSVLDLYISLINVCFGVIFLYSSVMFVELSWQRKFLSESLLQTPMWIFFSMMIFAGTLMLIRNIEKVVQAVIALSKIPQWYKSRMAIVLLLLTALIIIIILTAPSALWMMTALLLILLFLGVPITYAMGLATIAAIVTFNVIDINGLASKMFWSINQYSLMAIPLFIISGSIMAKGQLGKYILDCAAAIMRPITGGFAIAIVIAAIILGALTGAAAASAAALSVMAMGVLVEKGYTKEFGAGLIASGGTLAIIIPPSGMMILYGATSGVSIADLFKAGIVPGIITGIVMMIYIYIVSKAKGYGKAEKFSLAELGRTLKKAIWAFLMPVCILGTIYGGICTPTEAAAVSVIYAFLICAFIYKTLTVKTFWDIMKDSVRVSGFILAITMTASLFGFLLTIERFPQWVTHLVTEANMGRNVFLLLVNLVVFFLGFFMNPGPIILIVVPIIKPIADMYGVHPIHLGILMTLGMQLALLTPPVGANLYVLSSTAKMPVQGVIRGVIPFVIIILIALILITYVPVLTMGIFGL
jgi:C4-dicarboxylate transporter DctM subunit